jgi:hypothetical protein
MADPRLVNYIKTSLSKNIPVEQIKSNLYSKGWNDSDINEAINLATQRKQVQPIQQPQQQMPSQRPMSSQGFSPMRTMQEKPEEAKPKINLIFLFAGIFALLLISLIVFLIIRNASIIPDEKLSQGVSLDLKENKEVKFKIDNEQHSMKINSISADSVSIIVQSNPVSVTLEVGENKKIDFEQDGVYDLYIKLNDIIEGKADFLLKKISEECIEDWNCTGWSDCEDESQTRVCEDLNECNTEKDKPEEIQDCEIILNCSEQDGVICYGTETCNGTITNSSDGNCCLGECIEIKLETIACGTDINCLINASKTCHPANLTYSISYSNSTWEQETDYYYKIRGLEKEKCEFYEEIIEVSGNFTESEWINLLTTNTSTEINIMIQEKTSDLIGDTGICKYPLNSYALQEYLTNIKEGTFSSFTEEEIDEYQCTGAIYNN